MIFGSPFTTTGKVNHHRRPPRWGLCCLQADRIVQLLAASPEDVSQVDSMVRAGCFQRYRMRALTSPVAVLSRHCLHPRGVSLRAPAAAVQYAAIFDGVTQARLPRPGTGAAHTKNECR